MKKKVLVGPFKPSRAVHRKQLLFKDGLIFNMILLGKVVFYFYRYVFTIYPRFGSICETVINVVLPMLVSIIALSCVEEMK